VAGPESRGLRPLIPATSSRHAVSLFIGAQWCAPSVHRPRPLVTAVV